MNGQSGWLKSVWTVAVVLLALLAGSEARASAKQWTNGSGDNTWTNANNWTPSGVPTTSDDVFFDDTSPAGSTQAVLTANASVKTLTFDKATNFNACSATWPARGSYAFTFAGQPIVTTKQARVYRVAELGAASTGTQPTFDLAEGSRLEIAETDKLNGGTVTHRGRGTVWFRCHYNNSVTWNFGAGAQGGGKVECDQYLGGNYTMSFILGGNGDLRYPATGLSSAGYPGVAAQDGYTGRVSVAAPSGNNQGIGFLAPLNRDNTKLDVTLEDNGNAGAWKCGDVLQNVGASGSWAFTNMVISGAGRVVVASQASYWWGLASKRPATFTGCTIAPGGAGLLRIDLVADVEFQKNGSQLTTLAIDITNNVCDLVRVVSLPLSTGLLGPITNSASANRLENVALDLVVAPGDYTGMTFTNLLTSSDLSGGAHFFGSVELHRARATINYLNGKVTLTEVKAPSPAGLVLIVK